MFGTKTAKKATYGSNGDSSTTMATVSQNIDTCRRRLKRNKRQMTPHPTSRTAHFKI